MAFLTEWMVTALLLLQQQQQHFFAKADRHVYMLRNPEPIAAPIDDVVTLECEVNIKPDRFQWRHYPLAPGSSDAAPIPLAATQSTLMPTSQYHSSGRKSTLQVPINSRLNAGDYQCLAHYGSAVVASIPGRVSIAHLDQFQKQPDVTYTVTVGNNVALKCESPSSNPPATMLYMHNGNATNSVLPTETLLLENVTAAHSGTYNCSAYNYLTSSREYARYAISLNVVHDKRPQPPRFLVKPPSDYTVTAEKDVFMECVAVGEPPPKVTWKKLNGPLPAARTELHPGGLRIINATAGDQGIYVCQHGSLVHKIMLVFYEPPMVQEPFELTPPYVKEGEPLDLECNVTGTPEPIVSWLLNGHSVINDSAIEAVGNKLYFRPVKKKHAGYVQCFASNVVGTNYESFSLQVYPKQISSIDELTTPPPPPPPMAPANNRNRKKSEKRKPKHKKGNTLMMPPSRPNVTRLSDESVMVRWSVPENDGLPIQFFKVQYRELGPAGGKHSIRSRWKTTNADIPPHVNSYEVDSLKPDYIYRFRIVAVYSNNDNRNGPNSAKFHLRRLDFYSKNPLPIPKLTGTEATGPDSIRIHWEYVPNPNVSIDGFYVYYQPASSAADYDKATVDGENARSYVIAHLQPDTSYDIKIQSFTTTTASEFSMILKQKTLRLVTELSTTEAVTASTVSRGSDAKPSWLLYVIIGASVLIVAAVTGVGVFLYLRVCRKNKPVETADDNGKRNDRSEKLDHHIQADDGYIVGVKTNSMGRTIVNGVTQAHITITPNPLADADDNQNQSNVMEMSCLSSQNNNCATVEPSTTAVPAPNKKGRIRPRSNDNKDVNQSGENYV